MEVMEKGQVAEVQGPYGPVTVSEKVIQRVWLQQAFSQEKLRTESGQTLRILEPGAWNLQEGPDFRDAKLEIGGQRVTGDVEIHFYADGWEAHRHHLDPAFDGVLLHVVLFRSAQGRQARTRAGRLVETFVLLDHLECDLEALAAEQSLQSLENHDALAAVEFLASMDEAGRLHHVRQCARLRWQQKRGFARRRMGRDGWESACQQMFLECLGYRRNRGVMSRLALQHPLHEWPGLDADRLFEQVRSEWKLAGLRPANHPRLRLKQYIQLCREQPQWPEKLRKLMEALPEHDPRATTPTSTARKKLHHAALRTQVDEDLCRGILGGTRLDTLMVDCLLPLGSAQTGREFFGHWFHWYPGDMPDALKTFLKQSGVAQRTWPYSNGLLQGTLQLLQEQH